VPASSDAGGNDLADCAAKALLDRNSWLAMAGEGIGNATNNLAGSATASPNT
jgi:hypothetical protein